MEIVIIGIIVLGYCMILGVDLNYILLAVSILLFLFSGFLSLFFTFCIICLLSSKRKTAEFLRFDKMRNSKYLSACYLVDGKEYLCVFPREGVLKNRLYQPDKVYHVMLNRRMEKVFDRYSIATCVIGFLFGAGLSVGIYTFVINAYLYEWL